MLWLNFIVDFHASSCQMRPFWQRRSSPCTSASEESPPESSSVRPLGVHRTRCIDSDADGFSLFPQGPHESLPPARVSGLGEFGEVRLETRRGDHLQEPRRAGAGVPERVHQPAGLDQVATRARGDLVVTDPRTDRPLQDVGILVLVPVDMGQHEPLTAEP